MSGLINFKLVLYCVFIPICINVTTKLNIDKLFRKGSIKQIHIMYLLVSLGLSYLIVNFLFDICTIISF